MNHFVMLQLDDVHPMELPSKRIKIEEAVYPGGHSGGLYHAPLAWYIPSYGADAGSPLVTSPNDLASTFTRGTMYEFFRCLFCFARDF